MPITSGQQVDEFVIGRFLGAGGMAVVYQAAHAVTGQQFALKFILPQYAADPLYLQLFKREVRLASAVVCPHLCKILKVGEYQGEPYIAMQFVAGESLEKLLAGAPKHSLSITRTLTLLVQAAAALDFLHGCQIVHRDVKPSNMLTEPDEDVSGGERLYVSDFGLATFFGAARAAVSILAGLQPGTDAYKAPEQWRGEHPDSSTDQYALGCVLYECLAGRRPFIADLENAHLNLDPPPLRLDAGQADLAARLNVVIRTALSKKQEARYTSCSTMVSAMREAIEPLANGGAGLEVIPKLMSAVSLLVSATLHARVVPGDPRDQEQIADARQEQIEKADAIRREIWMDLRQDSRTTHLDGHFRDLADAARAVADAAAAIMAADSGDRRVTDEHLELERCLREFQRCLEVMLEGIRRALLDDGGHPSGVASVG
jgi:serine/threonine protein kinase